VFSVANVLPMPIWLLWMVAPRSRPSRFLARSLWPFTVLPLLYAVLFAGVIATAPPPDPGALSSLAGIMALFGSEWGVLVGWVHYLAFDLFVARWIMNDAPTAGYRLTPILVLTLMAGPAGLLIYLALRPWLRRAGSRRVADAAGLPPATSPAR